MDGYLVRTHWMFDGEEQSLLALKGFFCDLFNYGCWIHLLVVYFSVFYLFRLLILCLLNFEFFFLTFCFHTLLLVFSLAYFGVLGSAPLNVFKKMTCLFKN